MADAHAHVNGHAAARVDLQAPGVGPWFADVDLVDAAEGLVDGAATLTIGAQAFQGTIVPSASGTFGLQRRVRIIGGAGGWGVMLAPKPYHNDAGVKASTVAQDAARESGEALGSFAVAVERLGADYVRSAGAASRVIEDAARGAAWWVDYAGVTHVGSRVTVSASPTAYQVLRYDARAREAELAVDDLTTVGVGSVLSVGFDAPATIKALRVVVTPDSLRMFAWCGDGVQSELADTMRAIVQRFTDSKLFGVYRYRVLSMAAERVNLQAVRKAAGLPDLPSPISMWPGVAGAHAELTPGGLVLVQFIEGDRTQPIITGFVGRNGTGYVPERLELGGTPAQDAARKGDTVRILLPPMVFNGTIGGSPATGVVTALTGSTLGTIETGSPAVGIGNGA